ncbi:hypothetical protein F5Y14DRAFT_441554 [Nemania sp. NC0429]|nr:hypothetical protein F5Y14DRAFT_441554 [Nemania sp. NC0429]
MSLAAIWIQFFPPRNGYELARILYGAGGKVYMLTRSRENAEAAVARIKALYSDKSNVDPSRTRGSIEFIEMDVEDFNSVKRASQDFLSREWRLDILFNNAGTGARKDAPPLAQGHEYHFAVNILGGGTARDLPGNSVRVVYPASIAVEMMTPKSGINPTFLENTQSVTDLNELYSTSKAGAYNTPVVYIAGNPGNYVTNIWRRTPALLYYLLGPILRDPVQGAETYLWMAFSESVTAEEAQFGAYATCDGRWHPGQRSDIRGSGRASELFDWCEAKVGKFVQ